MKKLTIIFLTLILILNMFVPVMAEKSIILKINGNVCNTDVAPVLDNQRTLIPARAVFEELGATVEWNEVLQCVSIKFRDDIITLYIGHATALVNSYVKELDVPAKIIGGRTMIPLRFVGENFGMDIGWDDATYTVSVNYNENEKKMHSLYSVDVSDSKAKTYIEIGGVGKIKPSVMELTNPSRLVLDFKDCVLTSKETSFSSRNPNIQGIRLGQFEEDVARVVIDLGDFVEYSLINTDYSVGLSLENKTGELVGNEPEDVIEAPDSDSAQSGNTGYISPVKLSEAAKDKLLFIDPGHGGAEVGAIGKLNNKEIYEKTINIKLAKMVNEMLVNNGVKTHMLRNGDETIAVSKRPEIANEMGAHFYMSLHNNASEAKSVHGVQICYSDATAEFSGISNLGIAEIFYNNIASLGLRRAGLINNSKYIVIYKANMPSIIVESAFMSNTSDLSLLTNDEFLEKLAQKICDSAIEVMNKSASSKIINP